MRAALVSLMMMIGASGAEAATISFSAKGTIQGSVPSFGWQGVTYSLLEAVFGKDLDFTLNFNFSSLDPTWTFSNGTEAMSRYDLRSVDVIASNGRVFSFAGLEDRTDGLHITDSDYYDRIAGSQTIVADEISYIDIISPGDTRFGYSGFIFDYVYEDDEENPVVRGTDISVLAQINDFTPNITGNFGVHTYFGRNPDGTLVDTFSDFYVTLSDYQMLSGPAVVPLPASGVLLLGAVAGIGGLGLRRRAKVC